MPDAIVGSNRYRTPTIAQRRDGGVVLRQSRSYIVLDRFVSDAPELGKLARFPIATKSPQTDK